MDMTDIIARDGYLVYRSTGEKVVWYECDPNKNVECDQLLCRLKSTHDGDHEYGFCSKTTNPVYRKDGGKAWYAAWKTADDGEPYWGREYIEGV